jgi:ACS family tartrate transporter-like MFS transporter
MVIVRLGGALWLAIICTTWGIVAGCFAAINSRAAFLTLRMLLGIAEVGS